MRTRLISVCLLAFFLSFTARAHANQDMVQFGSNIVVQPDKAIHDAVCFFCNVDDRGIVDGNIVVFFGNVHISGHANHDVVNFFGTVMVDHDGAIGQNLVNFFGGVRLGENASVGKDIVSMFGAFHAAESASNGGNRVVQPPWLFWGPFLLLLLGVIVLVREFRSYRRRVLLRQYPMPRP